MELRDWIKTTRKRLKLTQSALAEQANISLPTVQNIEAGKANPSWEVLNAILKVLNLTIEIHATNLDWSLLAALGIPLSVEDTWTGPRTKNLLIQELQRVLLEYQAKKLEQRQCEALLATLLAIETHYPLLNKQFDRFSEENKSLRKKFYSGKVVKLRRSALGILAQYL